MILSVNNCKRNNQYVSKQIKQSNQQKVVNKTISSNPLNKHEMKDKSNWVQDGPLLYFTSFQSYLDEYNHIQQMKREHKKYSNSQLSKIQTQNSFYKQQKIKNINLKKTGFKNRRKLIDLHLQTQNIAPFEDNEKNDYKQFNIRQNNFRSTFSKSEADNCSSQANNPFTKIFISEKFEVLNGWQANQLNFQPQAVNKDILRERSLNCNKVKSGKIPQNSSKKQTLNISSAQLTQENECKKSQLTKTKAKFDKQNVKHNTKYQPRNISPSISQQNKSDVPPSLSVGISSKGINTRISLTSINQLQEEIIMSRRGQHCDAQQNQSGNDQQQLIRSPIKTQQIVANRIQILTNGIQTLHNTNQSLINYQNSNLSRLKQQFEYLCKQQEDQEAGAANFYTHYPKISNSQQQQNLRQNKRKFSRGKNVYKQFKRFPTCGQSFNNESFVLQDQQNKIRLKTTSSIIYSNNFQSRNSPSATSPFNSIINQSQYMSRTKYSTRKKDSFILINGVKNMSQNKQNYFLSLKQKKCRSTFHSNQNKKVLKSRLEKLNQNKEQLIQNQFAIIRNSFKIFDKKPAIQTLSLIPSNNYSSYSLLKNIQIRYKSQQQNDTQINEVNQVKVDLDTDQYVASPQQKKQTINRFSSTVTQNQYALNQNRANYQALLMNKSKPRSHNSNLGFQNQTNLPLAVDVAIFNALSNGVIQDNKQKKRQKVTNLSLDDFQLQRKAKQLNKTFTPITKGTKLYRKGKYEQLLEKKIKTDKKNSSPNKFIEGFTMTKLEGKQIQQLNKYSQVRKQK